MGGKNCPLTLPFAIDCLVASFVFTPTLAPPLLDSKKQVLPRPVAGKSNENTCYISDVEYQYYEHKLESLVD